MSYVESIVSKFKGVRPMARALQLPPTTIQHWKNVNRIPVTRIRDVLSAAAANDITLTIEDVVPPADYSA